MDAPMFERVYSVTADGNVPVTKYKSKRTGLSLCIAQVEGPLVNGYFCLGTEAHDDDGLPHTLEHLVFLGSEDYPYKGVLDLLANRCLASGTNAWTDTDHTCYTMTNAGSEGFLNLLPIYMDHILYPTLTAAGYTTEVHHINEAGEDAGVVYGEMQARENSGESRTHLECQREMYPGHCGYRSETGGIMANLRGSTSNEKVCAYHSEFYRPENLCLIITGQIDHEDVFRALHPIEEKILSKGNLPAFTRPWQSTVPPLGGSVNKVVRYSADDETHGMVNVAWRGPAAKDQYTYASLNVLFDYLSESAISPLQRDFVEIDDPFCSKVSCTMVENAECCIMVRFSNVFKEKLHLIQPRLTGVLQKIGFGDEKLDMARMSNLLHRRVLDSLAGIEDTPHQLLANYLIGDFLFGDNEDDLKSRVNTVPALQQMKIEKETYWVNLINKYMIGKQSVVIIGEPSSTLREEMAKTEKERVAKQHESLGEKGLKEKGEILQQATEANEKEPPESLLTSVDVPDVATIFFHPIKRFSNRTAENRNYSAVTENGDFSLDKIPFRFQLDDIHSSFVKMNVLLDSSAVPQDLKFYLPLFCQVLFESPVLRDGVLISHEEVIAQLEADTLDTGACVGVSGSKFNPGSFPQIINIVVKVEQEKFVKGVQWLKDIMFNTKLVAERLKVVAKRLNSDIATYKRKGQQVVKTLMTNLVFAEDCNLHVSSILRQNRFLEQTLKLLETEPELIESKVEEVRRILTSRDNITVHMSANVAQLTAKGFDPQSTWATAFPEETQLELSIKMKKTFEYIVPISDCDKTSVIAGVGSVESSFLVQVAPCVNSYTHDDLAPIMVFIQYVTQLEGPMWRQIRGLGLSYHYSMYTSVETGLLYFILARSTHIVNAYKEGRDIVMGYLNGTTEFTDVELESAKSSLTFEIIETETTVSDVSHQSLLAYFKGVSQSYNKEFLKKISKVTIADLQNVGVQYISALFDGQIRRAVCCNTSKVEEIVKDFKEIGVELTALPSLDEDFLCCVPTSS